MASFNKVILMGNLTRDPEVRVTPKGTAVCQIGLAVNHVFRDKEGNSHEETTFVDIDAFGRSAETIGKYMRKGRAILIEGRLKLDTWESKEGEKRSKLKVVLDNFQFVGGRGDSDSGGGDYESSSPPSRAASRSAAGAAAAGGIDEEDVPF